MRRTFAVGRLTPDSAEIVLLADGNEEETPRRRPFPGPWSLRAIVRDLRPRTADEEPRDTIH